MYKELSISSEVPIAKLRKAVKDGKLNLTKKELNGSGATLHVQPESYSKAQKAKKANKGVRLFITKHEIEHPIIEKSGSGMHGASIWGKN
ncbi:hypothetical protein PHYSODRAFT_513663 [Phytophthora sojae]|uniref:Uncharacterized protein n=1 Tax=Phytophthora sojae (strain P6497) TaxID=1094619 RepID=G4ZS59_PHYSP|nr:hypothetical protein PHYSODRAFT_513663 [Phytophthora sojae]EGZ14355.1 hypothetical protein PHYSODRAFT_513663 [Phytophthora sojae]|eukprot:XP_009531784.1 hypothetical protein PHYSODRAFT_513663 [Phytophthora sojae]